MELVLEHLTLDNDIIGVAVDLDNEEHKVFTMDGW